MRRELDRLISAELTLRERLAIEDMKRATGITMDSNLVRTALYRFAAHLDAKVDVDMFRVRGPRDVPGARRGKAVRAS